MKAGILALAGVALAAAATIPTAAFAGGPHVGFSISIGGPPVAYYPPPPVAYYPPPPVVYYPPPPPVAYYPRPYYYAPPTIVFRAGGYSGGSHYGQGYDRGRGHRGWHGERARW